MTGLPTGGQGRWEEKTVDKSSALRNFKKPSGSSAHPSNESTVFKPVEPNLPRETKPSSRGKNLHTNPFAPDRDEYIPGKKALIQNQPKEPHPTGIRTAGSVNRPTSHVVSHDPSTSAPADLNQIRREGIRCSSSVGEPSLLGVLRPEPPKPAPSFVSIPPWATSESTGDPLRKSLSRPASVPPRTGSSSLPPHQAQVPTNHGPSPAQSAAASRKGNRPVAKSAAASRKGEGLQNQMAEALREPAPAVAEDLCEGAVSRCQVGAMTVSSSRKCHLPAATAPGVSVAEPSEMAHLVPGAGGDAPPPRPIPDRQVLWYVPNESMESDEICYLAESLMASMQREGIDLPKVRLVRSEVPTCTRANEVVRGKAVRLLLPTSPEEVVFLPLWMGNGEGSSGHFVSCLITWTASASELIVTAAESLSPHHHKLPTAMSNLYDLLTGSPPVGLNYKVQLRYCDRSTKMDLASWKTGARIIDSCGPCAVNNFFRLMLGLPWVHEFSLWPEEMTSPDVFEAAALREIRKAREASKAERGPIVLVSVDGTVSVLNPPRSTVSTQISQPQEQDPEKKVQELAASAAEAVSSFEVGTMSAASRRKRSRDDDADENDGIQQRPAATPPSTAGIEPYQTPDIPPPPATPVSGPRAELESGTQCNSTGFRRSRSPAFREKHSSTSPKCAEIRPMPQRATASAPPSEPSPPADTLAAGHPRTWLPAGRHTLQAEAEGDDPSQTLSDLLQSAYENGLAFGIQAATMSTYGVSLSHVDHVADGSVDRARVYLPAAALRTNPLLDSAEIMEMIQSGFNYGVRLQKGTLLASRRKRSRVDDAEENDGFQRPAATPPPSTAGAEPYQTPDIPPPPATPVSDRRAELTPESNDGFQRPDDVQRHSRSSSLQPQPVDRWMPSPFNSQSPGRESSRTEALRESQAKSPDVQRHSRPSSPLPVIPEPLARANRSPLTESIRRSQSNSSGFSRSRSPAGENHPGTAPPSVGENPMGRRSIVVGLVAFLVTWLLTIRC